MCLEPTTMLTALKVVSSVASFVGQNKAADEANAYNAARQQKIAAEANTAFQLDAARLRDQERQKDIADSIAITQASIESARRSATAEVMAGERGASGAAVEHLLADFERGRLAHLESIQTQSDFDSEQAAYNLEALDSRRKSRINSGDFQPVRGPSILQPIGEIGGALFDHRTATSKQERTTTKP